MTDSPPGVALSEDKGSRPPVEDLVSNSTILAVPLTPASQAGPLRLMKGETIGDFVKAVGGVDLPMALDLPDPTVGSKNVQVTMSYGRDNPAAILADMDVPALIAKVQLKNPGADPIAARPLLELRLRELVLEELLTTIENPKVQKLLSEQTEAVLEYLGSCLTQVENRIRMAGHKAVIDTAVPGGQ